MPAIGHRNVHACARAGRRRISPMEETAECPNAVGSFAAMAIDRPGWSVVWDSARSGGVPDGRCRRSEAVQSCIHDDEAGGRSDKRKRPFVGRVAAKPTVGSDIEEP